MKKRKLVLISNDAMVYEDLAYMRTKEYFGEFLKKGSVIESLRTVYPSITYPAHATMISGVYPDKTHITNNSVDEFTNNDWFWDYNGTYDTLFSAAKRAGYTTANVFWPTMGNNRDIDYNIAECWSKTPDDDIKDVFTRHGSSAQVYEDIIKPNRYLLEGNQRKHPESDEFMLASARDMILKYQPDFLAVHPAAIDGARHSNGVFNAEVTKSLDDTERYTKMVIEATKKAGVYDDTDFIFMSDHGQIDIKRVVCVNAMLRDKGFITLDENQNVVSVKAYLKGAGASGQVYVVDKSVYDEVYKLLINMRDEGVWGISEVFTKEEIFKKEHNLGNYDFIVETDGYSTFSDAYKGKYVQNFDLSDYKTGRATHGYLPDKGPQPILVAYGKNFKMGVTVGRHPMIDVAPTIAKAMGWKLKESDGSPIEELIK